MRFHTNRKVPNPTNAINPKDAAADLANVATPEEARIAMVEAATGELAGILPVEFRKIMERLTRNMTAKDAGAFMQAVSKSEKVINATWDTIQMKEEYQ